VRGSERWAAKLAAVWTFLTQPSVLVAHLLAVAVAWPAGRRLAGRRGCSHLVAALFVLSAGLILALTLVPNEPGRFEYLPPHYLTLLSHPDQVVAALLAEPDDLEEYANILLYVPLGFFGLFVWRSVPAATLCGVLLTVLVETCQYDIVGRAGSLTDIRNNSLGGLLGAVAAALRVAGPRWRAGHWISPRRGPCGDAARSDE
jgi:VanZ like family